MKKIFGVILGLLLVFSFVNPAEAVCKNKPFFGCGSGYSLCGDGNTCCSSAGECGQYPAPSTQTTSGCTQVASNKTSCSGTQSVACSQNLPTPGRINRYCCTTQADCNATKAAVQQQISDQLAQPPTSQTSQETIDVHGSCGENSIDTAIGCIPVLGGQEDFLGFILGWAIGIGGGIAFLLIVYAGFMITTSQGSPDRLKAGQELLTSAISGVVLLVLSVFVLRFIGIDILKIPGLTQ